MRIKLKEKRTRTNSSVIAIIELNKDGNIINVSEAQQMDKRTLINKNSQYIQFRIT